MPKHETIKVSRNDVFVGEYHVVYQDDPPERAEAVRFFEEHGRLFPEMDLPQAVTSLPIQEANAFLRQHPMQKRWHSLRIHAEALIQDEDLSRLKYLPELESLTIGQIGDAGMTHLLSLPYLKYLCVTSGHLTEKCIAYLRQLRSLRTLSIQHAPNIPIEALMAAVRDMPVLL